MATADSGHPSPSKASFDPALIAKGGELAMIGNCNVRHTSRTNSVGMTASASIIS